jgi:WD40 repeat protein
MGSQQEVAMLSSAFALIVELSVILAAMQSAPPADALPPGAMVRVGAPGFWHPHTIAWVGFAPDNKTVLTASQDHFRFWDTGTRKELARYPGWSLPRYSHSLSTDCKKMALANHQDDTLTIFDVASRKATQRFSFHQLFRSPDERVYTDLFLLSPDGRYLAVWDYFSLGIIPNKEDIKRRRFSLDLWDLDSRQRIRAWKTGDLDQVEFSPDGKTLFAQERPTKNNKPILRSWEIGSAKERPRVELPYALSRFMFLPDGRTFVGLNMKGDALHLFDNATGKVLRVLADKAGPIVTFAVSPDGKDIALAHNGRLIVQGLISRKVLLDAPYRADAAERIYGPSQGSITELAAFSPDGKTLAVADGRRLELWNIATGTRLDPDDNMGGPVIAVHTQGRHLLARDADMTLSLWDLRSGKLERRFTQPQSQGAQERRYVAAFNLTDRGGAFQAISPDGSTIAALWRNGPIHLFDIASGDRLRLFEGSEKATCLAFSPDGKLLAGPSSDGTVCLWDTTTGKRVQHLTISGKFDPGPEFLSLRFSPDARTLSASAWGGASSVWNWELATGNLRSSKHADVRYARNGWNVGDLAHVERFEYLTVSFVYSSNGKHVAAGGPRTIRICDAGTHKEVRRFGGCEVVGQSVVFSPDGKLLAAGLESGGIRFWDVATGLVLRDAPAHKMPVTCLAFADGKTLVSGSLDGTAIVLELDRLLRNPPLYHADLEPLWLTVGQTDAEKAAQAMQALTDRPKETIALCKERLRPVPIVDPKRLGQLIVDLQNDQYLVRQRATEELQQLGGQAHSALEKVLDAQPPVESRRRVEALLKKLEPPFTAPDLLRSIRAVEVLERIGTMEARLLLETLAGGGRGHRLTKDARDALERLSKRP